MKLIITESQLKLIIENEDGVNPDGELFEMSDIVSPSKMDKTFLRACKLEPGKYRGYYIDGGVDLSKSEVTELKYLVKVGGNLDLYNSPITELPMLSTVGGYLDLYKTRITELPMLSTVGGNLDLRHSPITELPLLTTVGEWLDLRHTPLGKKLKKTMSKKEIKNKFGVKVGLEI